MFYPFLISTNKAYTIFSVLPKVLKSCCKIEESQLRNAARIKNYLTVNAIVAWRILFLTFAGREMPDVDASVLFEEHEWKGIHCRIFNTSEVPEKPPSIQTIIAQIGKLGGHLGRKSDGHPGIITLFRGLSRVNDIAAVYKLLALNKYG